MALGRAGIKIEQFLQDVGIGIADAAAPKNVLFANTLAEMARTYRTLKPSWERDAATIEGIVGGVLHPPAAVESEARRRARPGSAANVPNTSSLTDKEVEELIRMIQGEAGNQPYDGQVAVVAAALNYVRLVKWHKKTLLQVLRDPNFIEAVINPNTKHWYSVPLASIPDLATKRQAINDAAAGRHKVGKRSHWWTTALIAKVGFPSWGNPGSRLIIGDHTFFAEKGMSP